VYLVEWEDGFQYDVFEDELMESPNEFYRPSPPKRKIQESIRRILREEVDNRSERIKSIVKRYGLKQSIDMVAGGINTIKQAYHENPYEFLEQFNNLKRVERDDYFNTRIYYMDENMV